MMVGIVSLRPSSLSREPIIINKLGRIASFLVWGVLFFVCLMSFSKAVFSQQKNDSEAAVKQAQEKFEKKSQKNSDNKDYLPPQFSQKPARSDVDDLSQRRSSGDAPGGIYVSSIHLKGATVFNKSDLDHCFLPYIKTRVSETDLIELSDCVTKHYTQSGFSLSRAVIPPQDVAGGSLIVKVVEGYISRVNIEGGDASSFRVRKFSEPLLEQKPLTQAHLERHLLLINDLPGVSVEDTTLDEVGEMSGAFELTLEIKTWQLWSGGEIDNRGTDAIGPYQSYQSFALNSLFGRGESLQFAFSSIPDSTDELNFGLISLDLPLNVHGMRISAFVSGSVSKPDDERKLINTEFTTFDAGVNLDWNIIRNRAENFWIGGGFWARFNEEEDNSGTYVEDKLYGLSFYFRYMKNDQWGGENFIYVNLRQGLGLGDASEEGDNKLSRFDGDGEFTKLYVDVSRNQVINDHWSLYFSSALQLSSTALLSSQEFYFGGSRFGRAYESGVVSGDGGFSASLELRYSREVDWGLLNGFQLYGFADIGTIWDRGNDFIDDAVLSSAGFGARLYLDYGIEADFVAAFPLDDDDLSDAKDAEFFFKLSRSYKLSELRFDQPLAMLEEAFQK